MYTVAGSSRRFKTAEQCNPEIARLHARLNELERVLTESVEKLQNELAAEVKHLEHRMDELERKNKMLQQRLEATEQQIHLELGRELRPNVGFDKIGIA